MYNCEFCGKNLANKSSLNSHMKKAIYCINNREKIENTEQFKCNDCEKIFTSRQNLNLHELKCVDRIHNYYKKQLLEQELQIKELQDKLENIALQANTNNQLKIQHLTKKYVKKVPRVQFEEKNVIYIITTERLKKDDIYILGKASNLTSRLSTYNKSDEHEVIYYQECPGDTMSTVENMVFTKLQEYRQLANRERFVLPADLKVDIFIDAIKNSISFFL